LGGGCGPPDEGADAERFVGGDDRAEEITGDVEDLRESDQIVEGGWWMDLQCK